MSFTFKEMIQSAPSSPGVYQMIDTGDRVLYIGKAKNLKNRLSSYMHSDLLRTQNLIKKVAKITLTICSTEEEALYLEHRFIQNIQPPFNILLKDHKSYPFLVLTTEDYPQILIERSLKHRGQFVQGPYPSLELAKQMLDVIVKTFQIRTCSNYVFQTRSRPCLQYQMQRCSAPCVFQSSKDTVLYRQKIEEVKVFFKEGIDKQIAQLESQMLSASCEEKFEEAANYRDSIKKLRTMQRQSHQDPNQDGVCDLIAYTGGSMLHHMTMVDGKIEKSQSLSMRNPLKHDIDTCIETIVYQLYAPLEEQWIPKVVLADISKKIHVAVGHKHILIRPAQNALERSWLENARESLKCNQIAHNRKSSEEYEEQFTLLEEFFLQSQWQAIECIDVAHHQGKYTVGAISRFHRQGPSKKDYRKYRLNAEGIEQNNDPLSIKQTLLRHLKRRIQDSLLPNLLIIDGGKAQLNSAYSVLIALGIEDMHILAMSKDRSRKNGLESYWSIHEQGLVQQKDLSSVPMGVLLLQEIRDEAHRVAGQFHYQLVKKDTLRHGLEKFSGLGDAKKNLLLQTFGGWSGLKQVSVQQLLNIPGIGEKTAQRLISFLKNSP